LLRAYPGRPKAPATPLLTAILSVTIAADRILDVSLELASDAMVTNINAAAECRGTQRRTDGVAKNDLLELIFDNPSGAPLALDVAAIGDMMASLDRISTAACTALTEGNFHAQPSRLHDVVRGSLRFRLLLDFFSVPERQHSAKTGKDKLTLASEVAGLIGLFLALGSAAPSAKSMAKESNCVDLLAPAARMVEWQRSGADPALAGALEGLVRAASKAQAEVVKVRYREIEVVLIGPGGMRTGKLHIDGKSPIEPDRNVAPSIERAAFWLKDAKPIEIVFKGEALVGYLGELDRGPEKSKPRKHRVIAIWKSNTGPAPSGETGVRYYSVDPEDVVIEDASSFKGLDGVILVHQAQAWL
jgi:hypothetical protein